MEGRPITARALVMWAAAVLVGLLVVAVPASASSPALPAPRCAAGIPEGAGGAPLFTTAQEPWNPSAPNEQAPDQWLAKLYTETLGCAPDQASYALYHAFVADAGCGVATLRAAALAFLTPRAFRRTPYSNAQRLLVLWRVARESEPEPAVYARQLAALRSRRLRWVQVARAMLQPDGFGAVAARACSGQNYGWDPRDAIDVPLERHRGALGNAGGAELQAILDRARPGRTVWLARGAVIRIGAQLVIPPGVRLATAGLPTPRAYAAMARLVRTRVTGKPLVLLSPGATLRSVWVDGQRTSPNVGIDHDSIDVHALGGAKATQVRDDRIDNTAGWSNLLVERDPQARAAERMSITGNLITGYATKFHYSETEATNDLAKNQFGFADGISNPYPNSRIEHNQLVDVTDVSVVVFKDMANPDHQHSVVRRNTIVNAGNSGWAAFTVDPLYPSSGRFDFAGTTIARNLVWTSPNAFLLTIAGIGTKPWFGDGAAYGYGRVRFTGNTTGSVRVNTQMAIAVSRMSDAVVAGNTLLARLARTDACPLAYIGIDTSAGSEVQPPNAAVDFGSYPGIPSVSHGCIVVHL